MTTDTHLVTLIDIFKKNTSLYPDKLAYTFLSKDKKETLTNKELLQKMMSIATRLLATVQPGARALLLLPPGLDYIASFLGCLLAGVVAVPAYPPRGNRHAQRILSIIHDSKATVVLTTSAVIEQYSFEDAHLIAVDKETFEASAPLESFPQLASNDLAFLQYTSGSTGNPKGVMVSHGNILINTGMINSLTLGKGKPFCCCAWLPPFHDMGLIGTILYPLVYGMHSVLMAPTTFLKTPFIWLKALSDYQANFSPAPNFAYDMCVRSITDEEKKQLDLSHWQIALNGSEPISAKTFARFSEAFKECGFQAQFCYPAYGMAEATLIISGKEPESDTKVIQVDKKVLQEHHKVQLASGKETLSLVSCGVTDAEHDIKIINPETFAELKPLQIGEIVMSGPTVALGYWDKPEITEQIFGLTLSEPDKKYLRTGDLGFLDEQGELFVTGRLKDLIIIRGHNIYPQDIETMVHDCHPALIQHGCAAFILEIDDEPELVIVQEVHRRATDYDEIFNTILQRSGEDLPILPARIILIPQATLPKTSSGKVQRSTCRQLLVQDELKIVAQWRKASVGTKSPSQEIHANELAQWMKQWFATQLSLHPDEIDSKANFAYYGVDSSLAVQFCGALEQRVQHEVDPGLLWAHSTIEQLAHYFEFGQDSRGTLEPQESQANPTGAIAIIGMSCRLPGESANLEKFWNLLLKGQDGIHEIPSNHFNVHEFYSSAEAANKINSPLGGCLDDIDLFDASFFKITPTEANLMDPQQRLALEACWEAFEHACICPGSLKNTDTSFFVGASASDYFRLLEKYGTEKEFNLYLSTGNASSAISGHLSYFYGTYGQSTTLDTACSSSLVAIHHACQELRLGKSRISVAVGVNIILDPLLNVCFSNAQMLSPDGRCKTFDAEANGYVRGEGCGVLILKRLEDALADGDNIQAIIKGSAVNQDGASNGFTAPNPLAQINLYQEALRDAALLNTDISYIEAHGTGTRLGDPIEISSISEVYGQNRDKDNPLYIGAVKSNIGHLEAASGIAGVIKTVLLLKNEQITPNLHLNTLNPLINLTHCQGHIPTTVIPWPKHQTPRRAAVSAFGFSGTNAHVILEEAVSPQPKESGKGVPPYNLILLSAKSEQSLHNKISQLKEYLQEYPETCLTDLAYTLACGREHFEQRVAYIVQNRDDLLRQLEAPTTISVISINMAEQLIDNPVSLVPEPNDVLTYCEELKKRYLNGIEVNWTTFYSGYDRVFISLPTYPFEHRSYWANSFRAYLDRKTLTLGVTEHSPVHPVLSHPLIFNADYIKDRVLHNLRKTMGLPETDTLNVEANFLDMGIDSLMAVQFRNLLQAEIAAYQPNIQLPNTLVFNYPTIQKVCSYIQEQFEKVTSSAPSSLHEAGVLGNDTEEIAVIGMACRFPGENNHPDEFFEFLKSAKDGIVEVPEARVHYRSFCYPTTNEEARITSPWGGFLTDIDQFDPGFFHISPHEAELMDPQHRILIETCWNALESACLDANNLKGSPVGLFVGIGSTDYATLLFKNSSNNKINPYYATGNATSMAAGHTSYLFGWEGPSVSIDTSCSSSLVAIHQAVQSLHSGESNVVFAGGVNLTLLPDLSIALSQAQMLSKDGRCKTFDEGANGYVRSEGCGIVVLKRLSDALRDGNRILALIKGSAVNQDGASNGLTAPNGLAQEKLYQQALKVSNLNATDINYIEAHGTGTKLGDPIEMGSIMSVYGKERTVENPLWIGSVKSNIGHMEAAAGIGSFIKAVLTIHHEELTPNLHLNTLNPLIDLSNTHTHIVRESISWKRTNMPRRAGVSSFGFSGTNAHIIIEEPPLPSPQQGSEKQPYYLIVLSAKTTEALQDKRVQLALFLKEKNISNLGNIAYTLACGRTHFDMRVAFIVKEVDELLYCLEEEQMEHSYQDEAINVYAELKHLYLNNQPVDWQRIYPPRAYSFVELPGYPFANKSYWAEPLAEHYMPQVQEHKVTPYVFLDNWHELSEMEPALDVSVSSKQFLLLGPDGAFEERVKGTLQNIGNVSTCAINRDALSQQVQDNTDIVYLIPEHRDVITAEVLAHTHDTLIQHALDLIQTTVDRDLKGIRFWWIIEKDNDLITAPLTGIFRTLSLEYPRVEARLIYLNNQELPLEFFSLPGGEYRYEAGRFYQAALENYSKQDNTASFYIDAQKSYLITGGLGGIGQELIKYLVGRGAKNIITLARSALNEQQKTFVAEIASLGATLHAIQGDVSEHDSLHLALKKVDALGIPVGGIIHAAGLLDDGVLMLQNMDRFHQVMNPKILGTWNLILWAKDKNLDFIALFSSIAGSFGSQGQANYAAANAFLNVIPEFFPDLPITTISWGPWPIGMAKNLKEFHTSLGASMPAVDTALDLMGAMIANKERHAVIADLVPETLIQRFPQKKSLFASLLNTSTTISEVAPELQEKEQFSPIPFKKWLRSEVAKWLKMSEEEISDTKDFFEYGVDSLCIMEMESRIEQRYGCYVPMSAFMQNPTVDALTQYLSDQMMPQNERVKTSNLILLNPQEKSAANASPLFFIHPASGNSLCYREISSLLKTNRPIYAIEQEPRVPDALTLSINDLAHRYLEQIKMIQPHGPYVLIGWSLGGVIAHEMAYLLETEGHEIAFLALLDSYSAVQPKTNMSLQSLKELQRYFLEELSYIFQVQLKVPDKELSFDNQSDYIDEIAALCAQSPYFLSNNDPKAMKQILLQCFDNLARLAQHAPHTIQADIHFIQAIEKPSYADSIAFSHQQHVQQWVKTTKGKLRQSQVPGNHYSILHGSNVSILAHYLDSQCFIKHAKRKKTKKEVGVVLGRLAIKKIKRNFNALKRRWK